MPNEKKMIDALERALNQVDVELYKESPDTYCGRLWAEGEIVAESCTNEGLEPLLLQLRRFADHHVWMNRED